jgi:hypothetical protein
MIKLINEPQPECPNPSPRGAPQNPQNPIDPNNRI